MRILGICGSLQARSKNLELLRAAAGSTPSGTELVVFDGLRDLPLFDADLETTGIPDSVRHWRDALSGADAVLIATPEYGFSLPGALKNAIDWVIGSGELEGKVVAITAAVPSPERGRRGLEALRNTLSAVRATIVGGEPIAMNAGFERRVAELVLALVTTVTRATAPSIAPASVASEGCEKSTADHNSPRGERSIVRAADLFEVHLPVSDLERAILFYRDVVGLHPAYTDSARQVAFFWIGSAGNAMLGLWAAGSGPQRITSHTAFRVALPEVIAAPGLLRAAGVTPLDFDGEAAEQPIVFAWMPAAAVFFHDPDGHLLEYIAMLPQTPRPEQGIVPWSTWQSTNRLG